MVDWSNPTPKDRDAFMKSLTRIMKEPNFLVLPTHVVIALATLIHMANRRPELQNHRYTPVLQESLTMFEEIIENQSPLVYEYLHYSWRNPDAEL